MSFEERMERAMGSSTAGLCYVALTSTGFLLINYSHPRSIVLESIGSVLLPLGGAGIIFFIRFQLLQLISKWSAEAPGICRALIKLSCVGSIVSWARLAFVQMRGVVEGYETRTHMSADDEKKLLISYGFFALLFLAEYVRVSARAALREKEPALPDAFHCPDKRTAFRLFWIVTIFAAKALFVGYFTLVSSAPLSPFVFVLFAILYVVATELLDDIRTFMVPFNKFLSLLLTFGPSTAIMTMIYIRGERIKEKNYLSQEMVRFVCTECMLFALFGIFLSYAKMEQSAKVRAEEKRMKEEKKGLLDSPAHARKMINQ